MKNIKSLLILLTVLFCGLSMEMGATQYCGNAITLNNKTFNLTCQLIGSDYVMEFELTSGGTLSKCYAWGSFEGGSYGNYENYASISENTITFRFPNKKPTGPSGAYFKVNGTDITAWPSSIEWGTCAPADAEAPVISSATASNISNTHADIRVQATDYVGVPRIEIKNGATTLIDQAVSATTSLDQTFNITGLTKNTNYTLTVYAYDAAGNSSNSNVSFTTTNHASQTIYFVKSGTSASWGATPKVHYYDGWESTTFPGINMTNTGMTNCDNSQIWSAEIPDNTGYVIFNNGSSGYGNETEPKTPFANQYFNWERDTWYSPENLYILGEDSPMSWTRSSDTKFSTWNGSTPTSVTKTLRLTGNTTYQFKIQYYDGVNGYWRGNNGTMESNNCTKWFMGDDANCRITTGSTGNYTFTYDFTANKLSVTYPIPPVGCEGTSNYCTSGGSNFVHYTIKYIGGNILFTVNSTTSSPLQTCKLSYAKNTSGQDAVNNVGMAVTDGVATYTLPATGVYASGEMYFYITYKTAEMTEGSSASGFSSGAFQYNIGGCVLDDGIPYMLSASKAGATTSSVTLNVNGVVNVSGVETQVTQYHVSIDGGSSYNTYTATVGQITIPGLSANTEYTFIVKALYGENVSENSKSVTARTKPASQCSGTRGDVDYTIAYDSDTHKMTITVESNTSNAITALRTHWLIYEDLAGGYGHYHNAEDDPQWATVSDGIATAEYTIAAEDVGRIMLLRLGYKLGSGGEVWTANDPNGDKYNANNIFYIVGECPAINQEQPQMTSAATASIGQEIADIHLASRDNKTTAAGMKYHVNVRSTSGYDTEWDLLLTGQASGNYTLKGLVPGTSYTVTVYCEDGDRYLSTDAINPADRQQKTFSFTTHNGDGCSWTSGESTVAVIGGPAWVALPEGMTYILKVSKHDNTHIAIEIDIYYDPATVSLGLCLLERYAGGLLEAYLTTDRSYVTEFDDTSGHRHIKAVAGADLKDPSFEAFWGADGWTSDNNFAVKIEWGYVGSSGGGPSAAGYYIINPKRIVDGTDCKGTFVVTQKGRTPNLTLPVGYNGTFDEQILYYRQFTPGQWEPLTIPFDVASVEVYDPDDNTMFTLAPNTYYLLREQVANVSGADFKESWFNTSDPKPLKKKAYNIFFPMNNGWGEFYTKKYVLFRGTDGSQTVETSFVKGAAPSGDDQYTLYGNNTLSTHSLTAYFETSDGKYYQKETNRTLQPFECYVLANATTMSRMPRIGPWRESATTTDIENTWAETQMLQKAAVYNTFGQLMFMTQNTVFYDVMERCMMLPAGCYIIMTELGNQKIVIP